MKPLLLGAPALFALLLASQGAHADDRRACLEAAGQGQTLRDSHKLVEARDQFRVCAQESCPSVVQKDCAGWLEAAERSLPTIVVTAKDDRGADLADVAVAVDGQALVSKLDGNAIPLNPGRHAFRFQTAGGPPTDVSIVVREGEKNQPVAAVVHGVASGGESGGTGAGGTGAGAGGGGAAPGSALRITGWVLGGLGVVGLGVGAAFGVMAIGDKNDANCNSLNQCGPDALHRAHSAALVADIGLIGGGLLVAVGGSLIIFAPHGDSHAAGAIRLTPTVGLGGGGLSLGGGF
jgi:hypothetical protein